MVNYGRKKCKICGDKLIKKGFDKANNQNWYCKHCHRHYVFKRKDINDRLWTYRYIDFLLENKKIKDFNVSKSIFYRKISKFRVMLQKKVSKIAHILGLNSKIFYFLLFNLQNNL